MKVLVKNDIIAMAETDAVAAKNNLLFFLQNKGIKNKTHANSIYAKIIPKKPPYLYEPAKIELAVKPG